MSSNGNAATLHSIWGKGNVPKGEGKVYLRGEGKSCEIIDNCLMIGTQSFQVDKTVPLCITEGYVGSEREHYSIRNVGAVDAIYTVTGLTSREETKPIEEPKQKSYPDEDIQRALTLLDECLREKSSYQANFMCPDWLLGEARITQGTDRFVSSVKALHRSAVIQENER